jgi:hypothetical protein
MDLLARTAPARPRSEQSRRLVRALVVGGAMLIGCIWISFPRRITRENIQSQGVFSQYAAIDEALDQGGAATPQTLPSLASARQKETGWYVGGFPLDAYQILSTSSSRHWIIHWRAWIINLIAITLAISGTYTLLKTKSPAVLIRATWRFWDRRGQYRATTSFSVAVVVCIALSIWHFQARWNANQIARHYGRVSMACSVDHPLFQFMPAWLQAPWLHLHHLELKTASFKPKPRDAGSDATAVDLKLDDYPSLQTLEFRGALPAVLYQRLGANPMLRTFVWRDPPEISDVKAAIMPLNRLTTLEVTYPHRHARPSVKQGDPLPGVRDNEGRQTFGLNQLKSLRFLRLVNVPQTAIRMEAINQCDQLQEFVWQIAGQAPEQIQLSSLPQLQLFSVSNSISMTNRLDVDLRDLPNLQTLSLPANAKIDLRLQDVPLLKSLEASSAEWNLSEQDELVDHCLFYVGLSINGASSLTSLIANVDVLHRWEIQRCPQLRVLDINGPLPERSPEVESVEQVNETSIDERVASPVMRDDVVRATDIKPLLTWLAIDPPINVLNFSCLDLDEVDFSQLKKLRFLRSVSIRDCITSPDQLVEIAKIQSIRQLQAADIPLKIATADKILAANSHWETLLIDWSQMAKIEIKNQPQLREAFGNAEVRAKEIVLHDLPRLEGRLFTLGSLERLELVNLPQFSGLFVNGKIPQQFQMQGLTSLNHFCVQGAELTDEHLAALAKCSHLETLCLPNCTVSSKWFEQMPQWRQLSTLDFRQLRIADAGSPPRLLSDEQASVLASLGKLKRINLDRTLIGSQTINALATKSELQAISIRGCRLSADDLEPLAYLRVLAELNVGARSVIPQSLESIAIRTALTNNPEESSTFELTWNSIFTGELKTREQAKRERGDDRLHRGDRRSRPPAPSVRPDSERKPEPNTSNSPTP